MYKNYTVIEILQRKRNCTAKEQKPCLLLPPKLWELIPNEIKDPKSLDIFKVKQNTGQQINVLADFVKRTLAI